MIPENYPEKWQKKYNAWNTMAWSKRKEYKYSVFFHKKKLENDPSVKSGMAPTTPPKQECGRVRQKDAARSLLSRIVIEIYSIILFY